MFCDFFRKILSQSNFLNAKTFSFKIAMEEPKKKLRKDFQVNLATITLFSILSNFLITLFFLNYST